MNTRRGKPTQREQGLLAHVRRAQARKEPLTQYCRANGLNVQSVYNLRSRLARKEVGRRQAPLTRPKKRRPVTPFVAVRVATPAPSRAAHLTSRITRWSTKTTPRVRSNAS